MFARHSGLFFFSKPESIGCLAAKRYNFGSVLPTQVQRDFPNSS